MYIIYVIKNIFKNVTIIYLQIVLRLKNHFILVLFFFNYILLIIYLKTKQKLFQKLIYKKINILPDKQMYKIILRYLEMFNTFSI